MPLKKPRFFVDTSITESDKTVLNVTISENNRSIKNVSLSIENDTLTPHSLTVYDHNGNKLAFAKYENFNFNDKIDTSIFDVN